MAKLAIKGHPTRGKEIIKILEMLGGKYIPYPNGTVADLVYYIRSEGWIDNMHEVSSADYIVFTLEEFIEKFPFKVGDKVIVKGYKQVFEILSMRWCSERNDVLHSVSNEWFYTEELQPYKEEIMEDKGNISDGYHTFNELYEYRLLYNASMFNELAKQGLYDVHKSKLHSDGTIPFSDENWFIVQAELPTGQISNHYEMKDWDLFNIPEKEKANPYDGHTPQDVAKRLREFLMPKPQYPKTYEECCRVLNLTKYPPALVPNKSIFISQYKDFPHYYEIQKLAELLICRDAYWKIAGEEMGLGKPWEPDWENTDYDSYPTITICGGKILKITIYTHDCILTFPNTEMRDAFYENFKELIEECKEFL